jgi:predicted GNAT family acetyltransferase
MGEQQVVTRFWRGYADAGEAPRLSCRELLFEQRRPDRGRAAVTDLRLATPDDLDAVQEVQARMAFEECGVNPLRADPVGFRERCRRRIEKGRVWVVSRGGQLIFKADAIAETPEVIYLEGVHVRPDKRGEGLGLDCLSQLGRTLLARSESICLVVNEGRTEAQDFYRKAGYDFRCYYDTIYPAT